MDAAAHLGFWSWALCNMLCAVAFAYVGVRRIRARAVRAHRGWMLGAGALVGLFLVGYLGKVALLGREDLSRWSPAERGLLVFHEACVAVFLVAGATALFLAWRNRFRSIGAQTPVQLERVARLHRRAGWTAIAASTLGLFSAAGVLYGMFTR
jgi:uncharacterized membrane protein YozB (DUF420 family)